VRARTKIALAALAVALALGARVRAGEEDQLRWGLGDDAFRYDLEEDAEARLVPDAGLAPVFAKAQLISQSDFEGARRWTVNPRDFSELTWYFALYLPFGEYAKGGTCPVQLECRDWGWGALTVAGKDEIKRAPGGKTVLKAVLDLTQKVGNDPRGVYVDKGSTLTVERTYVEKKKQIADARFELDIHYVRDGKNLLFHHAGKVALSGKVDATQKGFLTEVQSAIRRGSRFLVDNLHHRVAAFKAGKPGEYALGKVALPTFACLRSGIAPAELQDAFDFMANSEWRDVYSVSLYIMCLEARSVKRVEVPPSNDGRTVARFHKDPVPAADKKEMLRAARWLIAVRKHGEGWWSYKGDPGQEGDLPAGTTAKKNGGDAPKPGRPLGGGGQDVNGGDRSNTQFATLALHVASTSDVPIEPEVWKEILDELAMSQESQGPAVSIAQVEWTAAAPSGVAPDGGSDPFQPLATRTKEQRERDLGENTRARGWGYSVHAGGNGAFGYGSMTGAGLSSTAIAREALRRAGKLDKDADEKTRRMLLDGVAWWVANWTPQRNPKKDPWQYYYYLYAVEKAMETAGVEKLGQHDWWREGCQTLLTLEDPKGKGRWCQAGGDETEDSSFALLFLNRATLPATITAQQDVKTASGEHDPDPDAWDQVFVEGVGHVHMRQVLFAVETATTDLVKDRLKVADRGFEVLDEDRRPRLVPDLVRLLGTGQKDVRKFALHALHVATGTEDEAKVRVFYAKWCDLVRACEAHDGESVAKVRSVFKDAEATIPLRRAALVGLSRLGAIDALGDLIGELSNADASYRRQVATTLVLLAGGEKVPYDPSGSDADRQKQQADWKAWWEKNHGSLQGEQDARAAAQDLGDPAKADAAERTLKKIGKPAVRALIDALRDARAASRAHGLLMEITGQSLSSDPKEWMAWWEKNH
jgi:hypothetical protein